MRNAVIFNELSLGRDATQTPSHEELDSFSRLLGRLRLLLQEAYLVSPVQLWGNGVSGQVIFGDWAQDPRNRDKLRQIIGLQNRAPFDTEFGVLEDEQAEEYRVGGMESAGLAYAHRLDLLAVSASASPLFNQAMVGLDRYVLASDGESIDCQEVVVHHASSAEHVVEHQDWLVLGREELKGGDQLWRARRELFANIDFLPRVENDMERLQVKELAAVFERLTELQAAIFGWDADLTPAPQWRTKVTPESDSRIGAGLCRFRDESGSLADFSFHARYTPGAGRIHFIFDGSRKRMLVAYIGEKLI